MSFDNHRFPLLNAGAVMVRRSHPDKDIEAALRHAERYGWTVEPGGSHAWGRMYCLDNDEACRCGEFCIVSIWSTPKNAANHARALRRVVDRCIRLNRTDED